MLTKVFLFLLLLSCSFSNQKIQWQVSNLDTGKVISNSLYYDENMYGASISKVFVAATLLDKQKGKLSSYQYKQMHAMITVSSNIAWKNLQKDIGNGSHTRGQELIQAFTKRMGYTNTRGFWGWHKGLHGNEINCKELVQFMNDTYRDKYPGASILWDIMYQTKTGKKKALKYLPSDMPVAHKTGTYHGFTINPITKKRYRARVHHHILSFKYKEKQYAMCILSDLGSDEVVALKAKELLNKL